MLLGALSRNVLLILGVVISHVLVLLILLSDSSVGIKSSTSDVLMVNLGVKSTMVSSRQKSFGAPQAKTASTEEHNHSSSTHQSLTNHDGKGSNQLAVGQLAVGVTRQPIHSPKPHYPLASRQLREQGLVIARMCVNAQGLVQAVDIAKTSGFASLDRSALTALSQWRFIPIAVNSVSHTAQCFQTPVQFTLES